MKDKIKWPTGNRLDLCIPLRKITVTEEGTQFEEYIPPQAAVVMVYFVGNYASYEYTPRIEDNKLFITDNGELKPGVYAIDVRIQEPERKLRSFRCGELEIVRETKQLALGDFVLDNNITLDADAFIFGEGPSAFEVAVRDGYTGTKAEWLESLRGREGRGIADIVALPTGAFRILLTDGSAYVTPTLKGEQGVSIVDFTVSSITSQEVICTITMSDGTTHQLNLPRGEKGEQGDAGEDGRGIQSVVMNNDYTITFSYTDGTSYTTPQALRGEQGAAGQDGQDGRGISSMALDDDNHLTVSYSDGTTYTTPQSLQGERGVSITDFEQVGESATMTFFNIYFSNGNISQIGLPKGEQGDRGEQGPQGPKGDTVVLGEVGEYKLYNVGGTATDGAMTQDSTTKAIAAAAGYYECGTAAGTAAKIAIGDNEALYTLQKGGSVKVKMTNANAAASGVTLKIGSSAATPLYYNGEAVSASNTWESGEVISVYYDGTVYQATNAQGGGGKAEKIKYDSQGGLGADNVQDALDEVTSLVPRDISCTWVQGSISTATGLDAENTHRVRSKYIAVKEGDTINVNPKGHYVGIYLYNTDKTTALGDYAMGLTTGEYSYVCPQDGFVRFIESKAADNTQDILPSEQIAEINIDASSVVTPKELDAAINDLLSTEVDISALSIQVGYPSTTGVWLTASIKISSKVYEYRYHKLVTRTAEMKKIKVDAPQDHAARYCFITDYTLPVRNSDYKKEPDEPTPCNFCEDPAVVHNVGAGSSSGWVDIPDNCAYIVLVVQNGSAQYEASSVYISKDDTDYDITGMRVLDNSAFVQGNFGADGKTNASITQRLRTNAYYKVNEGDRIILDYQEQKLQVWKYDNNKDFLGNTGWYTERIFKCENDGYLRFTAATARSNNDITTLYGKVYIPAEGEKSEDWRNEYADKVPNVTRPPRKGNVVKSKMLTLLTFSDIHLDMKDELQRILSFNDKYAAYLDDMISLGDLQDRGFESDIAVFRELADAGAKNVLQVIGNHDYYNSGANVWTYNSDANVYARFFAPFISNWGVVNSADTLYWYKDYTDTNTYTGADAVPRKIRLIAINTNNNGSNVDKFDSAQQTWLTNVLADAKTNDFSVIIASHYKPRMTYIDCNFSDKTLQLSNEENYANNAAATIIQEFIDGGGKFICWLCGHEHNDYVGVTSVAGTSQLVIGVSLAQCGVRVNYSVMDRVEGTKSQDLFNIIGFDTYNKHIRILRIGADFDIFMRSKKSLCINYETKEIIAQS